MSSPFIISIATMGGLAFLFALFLSFADKKLKVEENPLVEKIYNELPGANCGACGYAGCFDFATNLAQGKTSITGCSVGGEEIANRLANILGVEIESSVKLIPRILCCGGNNEALNKKSNYSGPLSCSAMEIVSGGPKLCFYGCLGGGDCVDVCPFDAMIMNNNGLPEVIEDLCTGCGICADVCPRNVIELHPADRKIFVFCKNHDNPKTAKNICKAACIGCGICVRKSDGSITMDDNLAEINYDKLDEKLIPFDKCPTNAIRKIV